MAYLPCGFICPANPAVVGKNFKGFVNLNFFIISRKTKPKVRLCHLLFSLSLYIGVSGQVTVQPVAARYLSLGAYSTQFNDVFGANTNAAALGGLTNGGIGVYGERRFNLEQLNMYSLSAALPTGGGTFGLQGNYYGFSQSNQTMLSLAYGRKIVETVEIGASFHYHTISQAGIYGSSSAITGSLGMLFHLGEKITAGVNAYNPFGAGWSKGGGERLPARYTFGMGFDASEKFFVAAELEKEESQPVNVNLGLHYQMIDQLFVRGGISTQTSAYYAGLGLQLSGFRLDLAMSFHQQLGVSPGLLLLYHFGKNKVENQQLSAK